MNISWNASGNLQETGPVVKEKPYVIQLDNEKPAMFKINSMTTSLPRHFRAEVSVCQTGAVDVLMPFPMPATILPTINCGTL